MNEWQQQLEELLFGQPVSTESGGLETSLQPTWDFPPWLVVAILLASAAIIGFVYWRENPGAPRRWKVGLSIVRLSLVGLVILMLYGWTIQRHRTNLPDVILVLDDSASMGIADVYGDKPSQIEARRLIEAVKASDSSRLNLAKALLLENDGAFLESIRQRYNLKVFAMGPSARTISGASTERESAITDLTATQEPSRLGDSLRDILEGQRGRPTAAIIVLSDGITTEGKPLTEAAQYARRKTIPLFLIGMASDDVPRDLALTDLLADEAAFAGDILNFDVKLTSSGYTGSATVRLLRLGDTEPLAEQQITLEPGAEAKVVRLSHRADRQGENEYIVEVAKREGELNTENNALTKRVLVRDEVIRVLLVQAYPSYEFRFLKQMLQRELNRDQPEEGKTRGFRTVLQEADLDYVDTDKSAERVFPVSRDELFSYDVLILGDVNPAALSPSIMNNIYEFVTVRGGGLIFISGPRYTPAAFYDTPLAPLFPADTASILVPDPDAVLSDSFRPKLSPLGIASPMLQLADSAAANQKLWNEQLTPIRWYVTVPSVRPGVRVLAQHPTLVSNGGEPIPIITLQFAGAGKVVFHATDETHRWRFRTGDVYFASYWIQTIRYLCRSKLLSGGRIAELTTDRDEYRRGEVVYLRVRFLDDRHAPQADDGVVVLVQREGGERRNVSLRRNATDRGIFEASASELRDGQYRAWIATPTLEGQPAAQQFTVKAPPGELARTQMDTAELQQSAKISGGKFYRWTEARKLLGDLPRGRQVRIESMPPSPIWNAPLLAAVFVALIGTEWLLRKRVGML